MAVSSAPVISVTVGRGVVLTIDEVLEGGETLVCGIRIGPRAPRARRHNVGHLSELDGTPVFKFVPEEARLAVRSIAEPGARGDEPNNRVARDPAPTLSGL